MISAAVIHATGRPERTALVAAALEQLPQALVVVDAMGEGDHRIANRRGCWPMARRAWALSEHAPPSCTHHLVLEDDAVLCADFSRRLAEAIALAPNAVLSLFRGSRYCSVATVMPRSLIVPWLAWTARESKTRPHHDQLIDLGCVALGYDHRWCDPSLVDCADVPSLLGHPPVKALRLATPRDPIGLVDGV